MGQSNTDSCGKTMDYQPPMTGNDNHTTYENSDDQGMVYGIVYPH